MKEIYGGRLPFLALYTDTATQDALASSAYADLRTAIVTFVSGIASETLDASRIVRIVDKRQLLVLFDPVNPGLYDRKTCVQDLGDAMAHHCTSARGDCFVLFAGLRQFFVRPGEMVSSLQFRQLRFTSFPCHQYPRRADPQPFPWHFHDHRCAFKLQSTAAGRPKSLPGLLCRCVLHPQKNLGPYNISTLSPTPRRSPP
jgi:hypothetical protein